VRALVIGNPGALFMTTLTFLGGLPVGWMCREQKAKEEGNARRL
jgi:hypothetical protein